MRYPILAIALLLATFATAQMTISLTPSDYNGYGVSFFGANDGSIDLTVIGGTPPYTYEWSNDATTQDLNNLAAGYYEVVVTDANGEQLDDRVTLEAPEELQVFIDKFEYANEYNVSCYNCYNGYIYVSAVGGLGPYTFQWDDGSTAQNRYGVGAGEYQVTVTDANGNAVESEYFEMRQPERADWTMSGNYGTNPATQYIGTADNQDVVFKANGEERLRLLSNGDIKILGGSTEYGLLYRDENGILRAGGPTQLQFPIQGPCHAGLNQPYWRTDGNLFGTPICSGVEVAPYIGTKNDFEVNFITNDEVRMKISTDGLVGIGTEPYSTSGDYRLFVEDGIATREVKVKVGNWPDYVFEDGYDLMSADELRSFINEHGHLPNIPSAEEVKAKDGIDLGDMQQRLLQVVEEQSLYILQLQEQLDKLNSRLTRLED